MNIIFIILILLVLGFVGYIAFKYIKRKELYKNKKVMIIASCVLLIIIVATVILVMNSGTSRYAKKMKSYLEKVGYDCSGIYEYPDDGGLDTEGKYFYCQMTSSNGVDKSVQIEKRENSAYAITYTESVNNVYHFSILGQIYNREKKSETIIYHDDLDDHKFQFHSRGANFYIGEQVTCDDELSFRKEMCEDAAKDVNAAMREFESYFVGAGLKLKK